MKVKTHLKAEPGLCEVGELRRKLDNLSRQRIEGSGERTHWLRFVTRLTVTADKEEMST